MIIKVFCKPHCRLLCYLFQRTRFRKKMSGVRNDAHFFNSTRDRVSCHCHVQTKLYLAHLQVTQAYPQYASALKG